MSPEEQDEAGKRLEEKRRKEMTGSRLQMSHSRMTRSFSEMRGVLTVTVHRCINLEVSGNTAGLESSGWDTSSYDADTRE